MADFFDSAQLVMIASGYKAQVAYSVLPQSGDGDFTHTRNTTAYRINSSGVYEEVLANVPALDYGPDIGGNAVTCPSFLVETARTNLCTYSFSPARTGTDWTVGGTSAATFAEVASEGLDGGNATQLNLGTSDDSFMKQDLGVISDGTYVFSFYAKRASAGDSFVVRMAVDEGTNDTEQDITITNDWQRFTLTHTSTSTTDTTNVFPTILQDDTDTSAKSFFVWGTQFEEGDDASSIIESGSATATRNQVVLRLNDIVTNSIYTGTKGTIFIDGVMPSDTNNFLRIWDGTANNRIQSSNTGFVVQAGGAEVANDDSIFTATDGKIRGKIAISWSDAGGSSPSVLTSQNGATTTNTLADWMPSVAGLYVYIVGRDALSSLKALAMWSDNYTQEQLNELTA